MLNAKSLLASIGAIGLLAAGCSSPAVSSNPKLVDPTATRGASGQTDDIYEATQFVIQSLNANPRVRQQKGNRVILNNIVNSTGIPGYDEKVIYNKFLSSLINTSGDKFIFLNRESVARERALQQAGQVKTSGIDTPTGADMALDIELLQIPSAHTKTIQYTFRLTNLLGEIVWQDSKEIVKKT
jgi:PBP1b-binding outer membrane lipoprotein LpoB